MQQTLFTFSFHRFSPVLFRYNILLLPSYHHAGIFFSVPPRRSSFLRLFGFPYPYGLYAIIIIIITVICIIVCMILLLLIGVLVAGSAAVTGPAPLSPAPRERCERVNDCIFILYAFFIQYKRLSGIMPSTRYVVSLRYRVRAEVINCFGRANAGIHIFLLLLFFSVVADVVVGLLILQLFFTTL